MQKQFKLNTNFNEFLNEEKVRMINVFKFIKKLDTWFNSDDSYDYNDIVLTSREYGNVGNETTGKKDVVEAKRLQKIIKKKFPKLIIEIEEVDEWVHLVIREEREPEFTYQLMWKINGNDSGSYIFKDFKKVIEQFRNHKGFDWKKWKKYFENITDIKDFNDIDFMNNRRTKFTIIKKSDDNNMVYYMRKCRNCYCHP